MTLEINDYTKRTSALLIYSLVFICSIGFQQLIKIIERLFFIALTFLFTSFPFPTNSLSEKFHELFISENFLYNDT